MSPTSNRADPKDSFKIRVLLLDDNQAFLRVANTFLRRQHELTVVGAMCGVEEALIQVQDLRPQVILIGLDRPGLEAISHLRKVLPGAGIIALALLEGDTYRGAVLAAGADDLVSKVELTAELLPVIRRVTGADRSW